LTTGQRIRENSSAGYSKKKTQTILESKRNIRKISPSNRRLEKLVTDRTKKLKQSLDREKILADMIRSASIAIDIAYPDGHVSHCNPAFFELTGYTTEELQSINWVKMTPPEFHTFEKRKLEQVRRTGKAVRYEKEYIRKDGSRIPIELLVQPKYDKKGNFESYFGFISDITQRKRIEEQLREAKDRLEYIVTMNPAAIYLAKPFPDHSDFVCAYISANVMSVTGFGSDKFIGDTKFWMSRVHPDDLRAYFKNIPMLWQDSHRTFEYRFLHRDETYHWVHEESNVVHKGKDVEVIGYLSDITERKKLEEKLLRSERLATIGELAAMVGHDLRNPLQSIAGAIYFLEKKSTSKMDKKEREMLEVIKSGIKYSNSIVTELLEYSKELKLKLEPITLKKVISDTLNLVEIPENVKVVDTIEPIPMKIDVNQVQRALTNLIENAIEAMPNGGRITIEGGKLKEMVEIAITDTGTGISKDILEEIWMPLYTTKSKGIGLGLAVTKRIVEAHNGSVHAESVVGQGSKFTLRIPTGTRELYQPA